MGLASAISGGVFSSILALAHAQQIRSALSFDTGDAVFLKPALAACIAVCLPAGLIGLAPNVEFGSPMITEKHQAQKFRHRLLPDALVSMLCAGDCPMAMAAIKLSLLRILVVTPFRSAYAYALEAFSMPLFGKWVLKIKNFSVMVKILPQYMAD